MSTADLVLTAVVHGLLLSPVLATIIIGGLAINPETGLQGYPPAARAAYGPPQADSRGLRIAVGLVFLLALVGGLAASLARVRVLQGAPLGPGRAWLATFVTFGVFNLFDLVVIDWLIFIRIRPRFVVLPGTEGMAAYGDLGFHLRESVKGLAIGAVVAALAALGAPILS